MTRLTKRIETLKNEYERHCDETQPDPGEDAVLKNVVAIDRLFQTAQPKTREEALKLFDLFAVSEADNARHMSYWPALQRIVATLAA